MAEDDRAVVLDVIIEPDAIEVLAASTTMTAAPAEESCVWLRTCEAVAFENSV